MAQDLRKRTKDFALRIIRLYTFLPTSSTVAQVIGKQVLRSGTSVGAHYREAFRSRSDAEFISKIEVGLQELEETLYQYHNNYYVWQLPEEYLYSEDYYMTAEAHQTFQDFQDDIMIQDLFNENQLSDGLMQDIDEKIDVVFKKFGCLNQFNHTALEELRKFIAWKLSGIDLEEAVIS